jgi:hypothetical protein
MVGAAVLAAHGGVLKSCTEDIAALASLRDEMPGWRASQFSRAMERMYAALGKQLSATPSNERTAVAEAAVRAARALAEETGSGELSSPAISALTDLVAWTSRGRSPDVFAATIEAIGRSVGALIARMEGRAGASTALNVYSSLIADIETLAPDLGPSDRFALWTKVAGFMADALPLSSVDPRAAARLAQLLFDAIPKAGGDPVRALEIAKHAALSDLAEARLAAKDQVEHATPEIAPDAPGRTAYEAMTRAIGQVLDANPAGPASVFDRALTLKAAVEELAPSASSDQIEGYQDIAKLLERASKTSVAELVMDELARDLGSLVATAPARSALHGAVEAGDLGSIAVGLVRARSASVGAGSDALKEGLEGIAMLPPPLALRAAFALMPWLRDADVAGPLAIELAAYAKRGETSRFDSLPAFCERFTLLYRALRPMLAHARPFAAAVAAIPTDRPISPEFANAIAQLAVAAQNSAGDLPIWELVPSGPNNRPGLCALAESAPFRFDPKPYLNGLLQLIRNAKDANGSQKLELARRAIEIASELGKLDRDPALVWGQVHRDFQNALAQPDRLKPGLRSGKSVATRAQGLGRVNALQSLEHPVLAFIAENSELPVEIALTAGMNLSAHQNTWLLAQLGRTRSRAHKRDLRDLVFAIIEAQRTQMIDAFAESRLPPKVIARTVTFVADQYRAHRRGEIPFDLIIEHLRGGKDPIAEIDAERAKRLAAALGMNELEDLNADTEGARSLRAVAAELQGLMSFIRPPFREAMIEVVKKLNEGSWPKARYEGPIAERQLAGLSAEQKAVWMQEMVTPAAEPPPSRDAGEISDAALVLKGLVLGLEKEVTLGGGDLPPLGWNEESARTLRARRDQLCAELRASEKGSQEQRTLSALIGPALHNLAAIELRLALARAFDGTARDPLSTLRELKPSIEAAVSGVRALGGRGCADALRRVLGAIPDLKTSSRDGLHAADEDRLEAWLHSYGGGSCVNPIRGQNRHALPEFISTPQYRMCRVCDGRRGLARGQLRLFMTDMDGVRRPAIWADVPYGVEGGGYAPAAEQKLFYRHALNKAMAMGVPLLFHPEIAQVPGRANQNRMMGATAAREAGREVIQKNVTMHMDYGRTGVHQAEAVLGGRYFATIAPGGTFAAKANVAVVMPPTG